MRRIVAAGLVAVALLAAGVGSVVLAAGAGDSPASQTHGHGVSSNWTLSWGYTSPYHVEFYLGDGSFYLWQNTTATGAQASYTFYPCATTVFHQTLKVWDGWNNQYGTYKGYAQDASTAQEAGGSCAPQP